MDGQVTTPPLLAMLSFGGIVRAVLAALLIICAFLPFLVTVNFNFETNNILILGLPPNSNAAKRPLEQNSISTTGGDGPNVSFLRQLSKEDGVAAPVPLPEDERSAAHPRVVCFINDTIEGTSCSSFLTNPRPKEMILLSIPLEAKATSDKAEQDEYGENDTCKYPDTSFQKTSTAPSTCNDIHSMGLDPHAFKRGNNYPSHHRVSMEFITTGRAKCVWKVTNPEQEETVIFKSNKYSRFLWDQNRIDALISGGAGNLQLSGMIDSQSDIISNHWNHILPMYQYCALSNIVPYADGTLEEYIQNYDDGNLGQRPGPSDTLRLALQAARGLHQAQLYWDGKPTFVHADIKPSQFLIFSPHSRKDDNGDAVWNKQMPILQINDFNQGRFLTRSAKDNEICPFKSLGCAKNQKGNRWHTPERFMGCVDQNGAIDTYSLGGVFFFLLTNKQPFYQIHGYDNAIKRGDLPRFPKELDLDHPAYVALTDVMKKCMSYKLSDRPSSLEVVKMLEEKVQQIDVMQVNAQH